MVCQRVKGARYVTEIVWIFRKGWKADDFTAVTKVCSCAFFFLNVYHEFRPDLFLILCM